MAYSTVDLADISSYTEDTSRGILMISLSELLEEIEEVQDMPMWDEDEEAEGVACDLILPPRHSESLTPVDSQSVPNGITDVV